MTVTDSPGKAQSTTFPPGKLFIGGEWREAADGARRDVISPATGEVISSVAVGSTADVDAAVAAARESFESGVWSRLSGRERSRVLFKAVALLRERQEELAQIESADVGKPITFARIIDTEHATLQYEYAASLGQRLDGSLRETPANWHAYVRREPIGVVAAVTPFNFPLILSSTKIGPALVAGNSIVHKPASDTPLSALFIAQIFKDAGVPDGVFNVVTGSGSVLGDHLVGHPGVDKVAFTGSTQVGAHAASVAGQTLKPFSAELGGNGANIIFADADLDKAIHTVIGAFVFNTGQFCMAGPRLLVERPIYETVLGILGQAVPGVPFGDITKEETVIGPLASQDQLDKVTRIVDKAKSEGATVVCGGEPVEMGGGFFYAPTVLADLGSEAEAVCEEVFGPVLTVQPFDTEEEAIALANSTKYGLSAGIQTKDVSRVHRVSGQLDAGIVWVNGWAMLDPAVPYGGVKASGWGREYGPEVLDQYLRLKSVVIDLDEGVPA